MHNRLHLRLPGEVLTGRRPLWGAGRSSPRREFPAKSFSAFIDHIKATSGAYPGATLSPMPAMAASLKGLEIVKREPQRRERLRRNVARAKN